MWQRKWMLGLLMALVAQGGWAVAEELKLKGDQSTIPAFQLIDAAGKVTHVTAQQDQRLTVICFLGTECPMARLYGPRLSLLAERYASRNVRFLGVNSNSHDSPKDVDAFCQDYRISFPVFKDPANQVADQFGAKYMAEVYVLDQSLAIRYHGRIDDQYQPGVSRNQPTRDDLRIAIDELLAGKTVSVPQTETTGCLIGRVKTPDAHARYTFSRDVSRILNQHCVECHRPGEIAPFALTDYHEVAGWGPTMIDAIDGGRMPPWNAKAEVGHFKNAREMPDDAKQILREWVASGMPLGDTADLPPQPEFATGWQIGGEPDLIVKMRDRPYRIPASGTVEYQYFVVDPHFEEERWVSASQVIPGNRPTVHHCIVFIRPPDGSDVRGVGYLSGYVPGQRSFVLPPGHARRVPAGSKLVFQMHYTPNGSEQEDLTQIGIKFIPESEVTHEALTLLAIEQEFEIPPFAADFPVHGKVRWMPRHGELLAIVPHMHVRGKAFQAVSRTGERTEVLLDVPRYDFNWQHVYELSKPVPLTSLNALEFTARFDNSKQNPANPDPSQTVTWGDQTWEEMALAFFEVSEPRHVEAEAEAPKVAGPIVPAANQTSVDEAARKFVDDFFARFDKNRDGKVEQLETPLSFRQFGFNRYDSNGDKILTREEIEEAAKQRRKK